MLPASAEEGLGKAEIEFAASVTAPLCWVLRDCSGERTKNGSVFFLDTGVAVFAVTACHVVEQCFADSKLPTFVQTMIGGRTGAAGRYPFGRSHNRRSPRPRYRNISCHSRGVEARWTYRAFRLPTSVAAAFS